MKGLFITLNLLGGLGVFLYGMKVMSEGLQKAAGTRLRRILHKATQNRFSAVLSGFLVCCAVQSSSATTVMVVSFCSAGLLSLYQSLGLIFGANIGTTTTGWIVSLLGFKVKVTSFALPLIGIGFFSQFVRRWRWPHRMGEIFVGFGLLFLGLQLIKDGVPDLQNSPFVQEWISGYSGDLWTARLVLVLVGTVLTMILQSSSAMMAVTLAAAASGIINFSTACALVLGENIGTTLTANLAAIGAPLTARRAAIGHFLFNVLGVVWVMIIFNHFTHLVDVIVPGDPLGANEDSLLFAIPTHIAAFHTLFNVTNTLLVLPFTHQVEKLIVLMVPDRAKKDELTLTYLDTPLSATPELSLNAASNAVKMMAEVILGMLKKISEVINGDQKDIQNKIESIFSDEKKTDAMEHKIYEFITSLTHAHLSTSSNKKVLSLMSMINDLERMGDHGEKIAALILRSKDQELRFSAEGISDLNIMNEKAIEIVSAMITSMTNQEGEDPIPDAIKREKQLNQLRSGVRESHIKRITNGTCSAQAGILFSDIVTSFEKMGDHAFNVVEASVGIK